MASGTVQSGLIAQVQINNDTAQNIASTAYGVCSTAANEAAKVVQINGFKLITGITIHVKFTNDNTAQNPPTLNVNGTGAVNIVQYNNVAIGVASETSGWQAGAILSLTYDGTYWVRDQGYNTNTTYSTLTQSLVDTGTEETGKLVTAKIVKDTVTNAINALDISTQRTFRSTANQELPIAGINAADSANATYTPASSIASGGYAGMYAAIPENTAKLATINPSTGTITVPGGIIANVTGNATKATEWVNAQKVKVDLKTIYGTGIGEIETTINANDSNAKVIGITGVLSVAHGGTGLNTMTNPNSVLIAGNRATDDLQTVRTANGAFFSTGQDVAPSFGTLPVGQGGTGISACSKGDIIYGYGTNTLSTLAANSTTTRKFLCSQATANGVQAPSWEELECLPLSGGTLTGLLQINGIKGTSDVDYGNSLPANPTAGRLFFLTSNSIYELPTGGSTGQALIKSSSSDRDVTWGTVGGSANLLDTSTYPNNTYYVACANTYNDPATMIYDTSVYVKNTVLFGAAWNDYAEYRHTLEEIEPGRCVVENGFDSLSLSNKRLQPGAEIVSDTFGFAIGQTKHNKTPVAIAGRVLAFPYEPIENFKPGLPVCSGPYGTVSIMTEKEASKYPWLIVGTVSSIPRYEEWGESHVKVKGRVWIRVR